MDNSQIEKLSRALEIVESRLSCMYCDSQLTDNWQMIVNYITEKTKREGKNDR